MLRSRRFDHFIPISCGLPLSDEANAALKVLADRVARVTEQR